MSKRLTVALSAICLGATWGGHTSATTIDLTASTNLYGSANGAVFSNPANTITVGTGVFDPFLRIQQKGMESGFNTDGSVSLDTKSGTWTHAIQLSDIGTVTGDGTLGTTDGTVYRQFYLDINQDNKRAKLSLDALQIYIGTSAAPATLADAGTLAFDLDVGADMNSTVLMDYDLFNGSGNGLDVGFLIPDASFTSFSSTDYLTMFAHFGYESGYSSNDGFEEISALRSATNPAPSPAPLALIGLGGLVLGWMQRRRSIA